VFVFLQVTSVTDPMDWASNLMRSCITSRESLGFMVYCVMAAFVVCGIEVNRLYRSTYGLPDLKVKCGVCTLNCNYYVAYDVLIRFLSKLYV
jgi:hypothetical protein